MLHRYVQAAMGWHDRHLYAFKVEGKEYGIPNRNLDDGRKVYDARRYTLARLFPVLPVRLDYIYDFGDWWQHTIEIERGEGAAYRKQYPICVDGAEPCPPEDVGGPPGYHEFLLALRDPHHPQHEELREWASSRFYSGRFSVQSATWRMRDVQRGFI